MDNKISSNDNGVLQRAVSILEIVLSEAGGIRVSQVVSATQLPTSTVMRILSTWEQLGYLAKVGGVYTAGSRVLQWQKLTQSVSVLERGRQWLRKVATWCPETLNIAILAGRHVVMIDQFPSTERVQVHIRPGDVAPSHCVATGMVLLSALPITEVRRLYRGGFEIPTPASINSMPKLLKRLEVVREQGFAMCREEFDPGLASVAIRIDGPENSPQCALGVAGPAFRMTEIRQREIGKRLQALQNELHVGNE